ncbi:MAG TPA: hypothetical protein VHT95_13935 [Vicinamibacterales bacterium]|nr:hypothetical protein [Vicinamibacterales bacterium]
MTEFFCNYGDDRDGDIVAFLYDDPDGRGAERARFELHLPTCARCQADIAALRGVRTQLARWSPPEPSFTSANSQLNRQSNPQSNLQSAFSNQPWWHRVPVWAQAAAALLLLGASAGLANLDVQYDHNGLLVRTGWSGRPAGSGRSGGSDVAQSSGSPTAPWKTDLTALESQLKNEIRAAQASTATPTAPAVRPVSASDADVIRRVRALVEESEKRQQRELALRIAELLRDVNAQRQADLVKIDRTLGVVQNNVGIEVMKNRQQINQMDLLYRASQRQ